MSLPPELFQIDTSIKEAIDNWIQYALPPGTCTEFLLRGDYDRAFMSAHKLIHPYWNDHILYVKFCVPDYCKGKNYDTWRGTKFRDCYVDLGKENKELFEL